jgi:hypothetical protein
MEIRFLNALRQLLATFYSLQTINLFNQSANNVTRVQKLGNRHWLPRTLATYGGDSCSPDTGYPFDPTLATHILRHWLPTLATFQK